MYPSLCMHENLNPGVCGYLYVWIACVRVCVYTSVLSPGVYGHWYVGLCVLVHVHNVRVQISLCEHVVFGCVCLCVASAAWQAGVPRQ